MKSLVLDREDLEVISLYQGVIKSDLLVQQLDTFTRALLDTDTHPQDAFKKFLELDPKLQEFISLCVWVAYKRDDKGDIDFGKNRIRDNPFLLREIKNKQRVLLVTQLQNYYEKKASKKRELAELLQFKKFLEKNPTKNEVVQNFEALCKPLQNRLAENDFHPDRQDLSTILKQVEAKLRDELKKTSKSKRKEVMGHHHINKTGFYSQPNEMSLEKREFAELLQFKKFLEKNPTKNEIVQNFDNLCKSLQNRLAKMVWIYLGKPDTLGYNIGEITLKNDLFYCLTQMNHKTPNDLHLDRQDLSILEQVEAELRDELKKISKSKRKEMMGHHINKTGFYSQLSETSVDRLQQQFKFRKEKVYKPWNILLVSSEMTGIIKSGGLAEAVFGKAAGFATTKVANDSNNVRIVLPYYSTLNAPESPLKKCGAEIKEKPNLSFDDRFGTGKINRVFKTKLFLMPDGKIVGKLERNHTPPAGKIKIYFIEDTPHIKSENCFDLSQGGSVYKPEHMLTKRWIYFSSCVTEFIAKISNKINVVNFEDFHGALAIPLLWQRYETEMKDGSIPPLVYTFHNIAPHAQGIFSGDEAKEPLKQVRFKQDWVNTAKVAMEKADAVTTVSETFSEEVQSHNTMLNGYLGEDTREVALRGNLTGITNGSNPSIWNPETDPVLYNWIDPISKVPTPLNFKLDSDIVEAKAKIKSHLQKWLAAKQKAGFFLNVKIDFSRPTIFFVGRFDASQKGLDLFETAAKAAKDMGANFICMGSQETPDATTILDNLAKSTSDQEGVFIIRDQQTQNEIGSLLRASCEFMFVPSSFEPCGLTQFEAWLFGALVIAAMTGGLKDTVKTFGENFNGWLFDRSSDNKEKNTYETIVAALNHWQSLSVTEKNTLMRKVIENGRKSSWKNSVEGLSPIEKFMHVYAQAEENAQNRNTMFVESGLA